MISKVISQYDNSDTIEKQEIALIIGNITKRGSKIQNMYIIEHDAVEVLLQHVELNPEPEQARLAIESLENFQKLINSGIDDHLIQKLDSINRNCYFLVFLRFEFSFNL